MNDSANRNTDLLSALAHELRNRIAPIRNAAALIRLRAGGNADLETLAELIERQLEGMTRAVDDALAAENTSASPSHDPHRPEPPPSADPAAPPARASSRISRRILIADDSAAMRESLAELLRDNGHDVRAAADGAQALELAAKWLPEVVLLDVSMPLVNGYEVARRLRAKFPPEAMKLVMMSGIVLDNAARRRASEAGFDACIDKVVDLETLEKMLGDAGSA